MTRYADQISSLPLIEHLRASAGRDHVSRAEVEQLTALVLNTADEVGPLLARIPLTFRQYTGHDIHHSRNLIDLMGRFIPTATLERLNAAELTILVLSALLHDSGMFVADDEKAATLASQPYRRFEASMGERATLLAHARKSGEHLRAATLQDALLAEYFRRLHPERAAGVVTTHFAGKLTFRGTDLAPAVLRVCESHGWGVLESNDPRHPLKAVARLSTNRPLPGVPVNERYLACCLRLADIMDFDRSRTPAAVFQHLSFTESKSWEEWNKHLQVTGWHVDPHQVMYAIPCTHPAFYVAVMEFLDWIDAELRDCRHLMRDTPGSLADRYELTLPAVVDRRQVEMQDPSYVAGAFRFQLEYEPIMQLLMDRSLYPDPSLFLRELLQNALDACRTRQAHARAAGAAYTPRIVVRDLSGDPDDPRIIFQDNGIGMSRRIVSNYFMRVGRSYYRSAEFEMERQRLADAGVELEATSHFGIGILSCFMVADRFEVETYRVGDRPLHITIEGATRYFVIQQLPEPERTDFPLPLDSDGDDGPPARPGTRLTVHLRPPARLEVYQVLQQFAVNVECEIVFHDGAAPHPATIPAKRWQNEIPRPAGVGGWHERWGTDPALPVLDSLMVPERFPIDQFDFASHIGGQGWFWLLRGADGKPLPSRGYLEVGTSLRCAGVAAFLGDLISHEGGLSNERIEASLEQAEMGKNPWQGLADGSPDRLPDSARMWDSLPPDEQSAVITYLATALEADSFYFTFRPWYRDAGTAQSLACGTLGWAERRAGLHYPLQDFSATEEFALYGIRLPGGIAYWDPVTGNADRREHVKGPAGFAADIRYRGVTPAANRLFIDSSQAKPISIPLIRAFIRHGIELASTGAPADVLAWRRWFGEVVIPLFYNWRWELELRLLETQEVERALGYLCFDGERQVVRTRDDLIAAYGRSVAGPGASPGQPGLVRADPVNTLLISARSRGPGGTIDFESRNTWLLKEGAGHDLDQG